MKKAFPFLASVLVCSASASAAEPAELKFGGERIGVPPLALAESAKRAATANAPKFGTKLPFSSDSADPHSLSPHLVPRTPSLRSVPSKSRTTPQVSRSSGMPIIKPNETVDYAMTIVPPDPTIDFKLIVKDPGPAEKTERETAK
jgi:hypothetical protein